MAQHFDFTRAMVGDRIPKSMRAKRTKKKKSVTFDDGASSADDGGSQISIEDAVNSEAYFDVYEDGDYTALPVTEEQMIQSKEALAKLGGSYKRDRIYEPKGVVPSEPNNRDFVLQKSLRRKHSHQVHIARQQERNLKRLNDFANTDSSKYPVPPSVIDRQPLKPSLRTKDYMRLCSAELGSVVCNHLYLYDGNVRDFYHTWAAISNCITNDIVVTFPLKDIVTKIRLSSAVVHRILFSMGDYMTNRNTIEITCKFNDMTPLQQESRDEEDDNDLFNKAISGNDLLTVAQDRLKCKLIFTTTSILGMDGAELFIEDIEKKEGVIEFVKMEEFTIKE